MKNYTKIALKGFSIVFIFSLVSAFAGYLVRFILARNLSVEQFGLFYSVFAFLGFMGIFKSLGLDRALVKFIPEFLEEKAFYKIKSSIVYVALVQFLTNLLILLLLYAFSHYLSIHFFKSPEAVGVIKILALAFFLDSFVYVLKFCFQGFQRMDHFSSIDIVRMWIILIVVVLGLKFGLGIYSAVYAYVLAPLLILLLYGHIFFKKTFNKFFREKSVLDKRLFSKITKYGFFVMAAGAANLIISTMDTLSLTYLRNLSEVGLYNVALPTAKILLYFPFAIGYVLFPLTAELWAKSKTKLLKHGMESLFKFVVVIAVPLAFGLYSFSDIVISLLFGEEYILASNALKILSIGMIFAALHTVATNFFLGIGESKLYSNLSYIAAAFNLVGNLILIPIIGIDGAALSTTLTYLLLTFMGLVKVRNFIDLNYPIKDWSKTLLIGLLFAFMIYKLKEILSLGVWAEPLVVLTFSGAMYCFLILTFRVVSLRELKEIMSNFFRKV